MREFTIILMKGMHVAMNETAGLSKGFHDAFQQCSKEIKEFENITSRSPV